MQQSARNHVCTLDLARGIYLKQNGVRWGCTVERVFLQLMIAADQCPDFVSRVLVLYFLIFESTKLATSRVLASRARTRYLWQPAIYSASLTLPFSH